MSVKEISSADLALQINQVRSQMFLMRMVLNTSSGGTYDFSQACCDDLRSIVLEGMKILEIVDPDFSKLGLDQGKDVLQKLHPSSEAQTILNTELNSIDNYFEN